MKKIEIDRSKPLRLQPHTGHNRWHPDISPLCEVEEGEEVVLETRDAVDGQFNNATTEADFAKLDPSAIHPLTGPVYVKGAKPGDLLEVQFVDITPAKWAFSAVIPGFGFLRDVCTTPFMVHWNLDDNYATSPQIPGVRIPGAPFMGLSGVAPSHAEVEAWTRREAELANRGGMVLLPDATGAVPAEGAAATHGLRTLPPREGGGNFDVKQLTKGSKLFLPVSVDGALFSTGDGHFAQGDGEVCVTAVEMAATCTVRFKLHKGLAAKNNIKYPRLSHDEFFADPRYAMPRKFIGVMGYPLRDDDGYNDGENLTLACRNAILNMMQVLQERGYTREQAYVICSVAADLRISNVVDVPNVTVSALISEEIFAK